MIDRDCTTCAYNETIDGGYPCCDCIAADHWAPLEPAQATDEPTIKDSGERREFESGAVRDMQTGKGRCDLMPLEIIAMIAESNVIQSIGEFQSCGDVSCIEQAVLSLLAESTQSKYAVLLELAKHFEAGALKYGERNWEKGLPESCYIDSAVRHYLKHKAGWLDEPHYTACLWNLVALWWTHENITAKESEE